MAARPHDAFISYRRGDGAPVARWLRNRLQRYRPPKRLRRRSTPLDVYLDTSFETATTNFYEHNIAPALERSRHLIVVATPSCLEPGADGGENWVVREIRDFRRLPQKDRIIVTLGATMPDARLPGELERDFPHIERVDLRGAGTTGPFAFSERARLHQEFLKIAAPLWDITPAEMPELRQEEAQRRFRRMVAVLASAVALLIVLTALLVWGMVNLASSRRQLAANHLAQGQRSVASAPAEARLHFVRAIEIAEGTRLPWLRLAAEAASARAWLGLHHRDAPTRILQHPDTVGWARFDPSSRRLATACDDGIVRLWNADGSLVAQSPRQVGAIVWLAFDRSGSRIAFATDHRQPRVAVWEPRSGSVTEVLRGEIQRPQYGPGHDDVIAVQDQAGALRIWQIDRGFLGPPIRADLQHGLKLSATAEWVAVLGDGTLTVWNVTAGQLVATLPYASLPTVVGFSGDGRRLAVPVAETVLQVFDTATGAAAGPAIEVPLLLGYGALDHSGARVVVLWAADGNVSPQRHQKWLSVHEVATGRYLIPPQQMEAPMKEPLVLQRGDAVLTVGQTETRRWELRSGLSTTRSASDPAIDFFIDERHGLVGVVHLAGGVELLDLSTLTPVRSRIEHADRADVVRFSPDGALVATYGADQTVRLAATRRPSGVTVLQPAVPGESIRREDAIVDAAFSRDGRSIAAATGRGVLLWSDGRGPRRVVDCAASDVDFSSDGRLAAACGDAGAWLVGRGAAPSRTVTGEPVRCVLFTPDGTRLITCGRNAVLWDLGRTMRAVVSLPHPAGVFNAAMSRDGRSVATIDEKGMVRIWDAASGRLRTPLLHSEAGYELEFSPDGRMLATSGRAARVWDVESGKPVTEPLPNPNLMRAVAFSPDGSRLLTGGLNGIAQVWDIATSRGDGPPLNDPGAIWAASFSPDGSRLLTATFEHRVTLWDAASKRPIVPPLRVNGSVLAARFDHEGKRVVAGTLFGELVLWDVSPATAPAAELRLDAELDSGRTIDETTGLVRLLSRPEWEMRAERRRSR